MSLIVTLISIAQAYNIVLYSLAGSNSSGLSSIFVSFGLEQSLIEIQKMEDLRNRTDENIDLIIVDNVSEVTEFDIKNLAKSKRIPTLFLCSGDSDDPNFYLSSTYKKKVEILDEVLRILNIGTFALIWPFSSENKMVYHSIKDKFSQTFSHLSLNEEMTASEMTNMMIRIFKNQGIQNYVFLGHKNLCYVANEGFISSWLNIAGNFGLFFDECIYQVFQEGSVYLIEDGLESASSYEEYIFEKLSPYLSIFRDPYLDSEQIINIYSRIAKKRSYSMFNMKNSSLELIASFPNPQFFQPITYYSNVIDRTEIPKSRITISANTGIFNPYSTPVFHNKKYHEGTYFGVEKINRDQVIFPHHEFYLYDKVDCGVSVFNYNYSKSCILKHIQYMGHAYIPTVTFINANFLDQLSSLQIQIPFIAGILSAAPLSNKARYPTFIRIVSPASLFSRAWSNLINIYGWKKVVMHYGNDSFGIASYETLNKSAHSQGYEIINDEKYRMINNIMSNESVPQYYEHMKNTISLGCNIIFLGMGDPTAFFWLEGMYDMGARRGDYTFIFFTTTGLDSFTQPTGNSTKRKELMHGSFVVYNAAWVGDFGKNTRKEFLETRNISWCRSYNIDAVYTAAKTTEFLMIQGKSFENNEVFNNAMRLIRFEGATGVISFDSSSNDRNIFYFNMFNFYEDDLGVWHDDEIALISPLGTVYFQSFKEGVWPTGGVPLDMKQEYKNCGFREEAIKDSEIGKNLKLFVSIPLLLIVSAFTVYAIKKLKYRRLELICTKTYANFEDYVTLMFIIVESIQIISIGPSFKEFNEVLSSISEVISLNYLQTAFWIIFIFLLSITAIWLLLLLASYNRFYFGLRYIKRNLESFKPFTIPIISNYLFIPIIVSLFSILMCDKSTGSQLTDSYLNYDCNLKCWKPPHSIYVVLACIEIVIYVPIAILYRTLWQNEQSNINIRVDSIYLVVKNMKVVIFVAISKILQKDYPIAHSALFLIIQLSVLVFIVKLRNPFNYDRANLWCKNFVICIIWHTIVCILSQKNVQSRYVLIGLQLGGWFVICVISVFIQSKLPRNLLVSKSGPEIKDLIMFSFGRKSAAESIYIRKHSYLDLNAKSLDESKSG